MESNTVAIKVLENALNRLLRQHDMATSTIEEYTNEISFRKTEIEQLEKEIAAIRLAITDLN